MSAPSSTGSFLELWQDFIQQSNGFWSKAATVPTPPDPSEAWKQFFGMWTQFWTQAMTQSPETFQSAQKLWMEQLDTTSKGLENVMGTDAYGSMLSKFFQEQLAWQDKTAKAANPQIDGALRAMNLPSRHQIDRLFERLIGIEERLDSLELDSREIRRGMHNRVEPVALED